MDRSYKDKMYFIDSHIYNCPFCLRKHVKYQITGKGEYDYDNTKKMYFYIVTIGIWGVTIIGRKSYSNIVSYCKY